MPRSRPTPPLRSTAGSAGEGAPIDIYGGAAFDPTANVISLVEALAKSVSDLREADIKFNDREAAHIKELGEIRAKHIEQLRQSDLDAAAKTRQVDVTTAAAQASQLATAVQTLATNNDKNAEAIRNQMNSDRAALAKQVTDTAATLSANNDSAMKDVNNRIAELQKSQYQGIARDPMITDLVTKVDTLTASLAAGTGKQAVVDPLIAEMRADQKILIAAMTTGAGQGKGMDKMWAIIIAGAALLFGSISTVIAIIVLVRK